MTAASSAINTLGQLFGLGVADPPKTNWWSDAQGLVRQASAFILPKTVVPKDSLLQRSQDLLAQTFLDGSSTLSSALASVILALLVLLTVFMSWSSTFKGWGGRFSPFGRSNEAGRGQVSDQDFSYITSDDIKRNRPARETDALVLKHKRVNYPVHFPAYSIDDGELKIGKIRQEAAVRLSLSASDSSRVKLFYKGRNLKDDAKSARDEGLRSDSQAEILVSIGEAITVPEDESEEEDETDAKGAQKKKARKRKKKGKGGNSGSATPDVARSSTSTPSTLNPDATFAPTRAPPPRSSASTPKPVQTPTEKLDSLASLFHTTLVPSCITFINNPPEDQTKREFDHKRLSETILAQVLLKLDAVETEGNDEARQRRKALVKEVQGMLTQLDQVIKK